MSIRFSYDAGDFELADEYGIKKWVSEVIKSCQKQVGNINYLFCEEEYMLSANRHYLNHDTYTDIITFDYVVGEFVSGDILINIDRVRDNAQKFGVSFDCEMHRVLIHGVLHLLGQGDKSEVEAKEMRSREEEALKLFEEMFPVKQDR